MNFKLVFWPYLSNAVELTDGFCAKMIRGIWRLKPRPQWLAMTKIPIFDIWVLLFCLYSFVLDVLPAGTSDTSSNIFLMVLCTIWHKKVNGSGFHAKGKSRKPQFYP